MRRLARYYEMGTSPIVKKDEKLTYLWYRSAADARDAVSMAEVGCRLLDGQGVQKNTLDGMWWLGVAVGKGGAYANTILGSTYHEALYGLERDL